MPTDPLPLFTLSGAVRDLFWARPRPRPLAGAASRRQLRRLLAIACANDVVDEVGDALVLELHRRLHPRARAE